MNGEYITELTDIIWTKRNTIVHIKKSNSENVEIGTGNAIENSKNLENKQENVQYYNFRLEQIRTKTWLHITYYRIMKKIMFTP